MRMSVPEAVRSSMLIRLSVVEAAFAFPREPEGDAVAPVAAGSPPLTTGRNPSGTSCLAYFRFHLYGNFICIVPSHLLIRNF